MNDFIFSTIWNKIVPRPDQQVAQNAPRTPTPTEGTYTITPDSLSSKEYDNIYGGIRDNVLDDYLSVKPSMVLSIVKFDPASKWDVVSLDTQQTFSMMTNGMDGMVMATKRHYQIDELNMKNVLAATGNNPQVSATIELKLGAKEPYGCSFNREMRYIAKSAGYGGLHPSRIVWRLDLWFSGYDKDGNFVEKIGIQDRYGKQDTKEGIVTHYLTMLNFTANVENGSTTYGFNFVPFFQSSLISEITTMAYDQEIPLFDTENDTGANRITFDGDAEITFSRYAQKFSDLLNKYTEQISKKLEKKVNEGENGQDVPDVTVPAIRKFNIVVPKSIENSILEFDDDFKNPNFSNSIKITGKNILEELVNKLALVGRVRTNMNLYPKIIYTVRPVMSYEQGQINDTISDITGITITLIIDEVVEFRVNPQTDRNLAASNDDYFKSILASGAMRRIYQYAFSESNSEVINFKISINNAWYNSISDNEHGLDARNAIRSAPTPVDVKERFANTLSDDQVSSLARLIGTSNDSDMGTIRPVYVGQQTRSAARSGVVLPEDRVAEYNEYLNAMDNLTSSTNFMTMNGFEVRGDPRWLFSAFSSKNVPSTESHTFKSDLVFIEVTNPSQEEFMNVVGRPTPDADFSGFYQVLAVEHRIQQNLYTQTFDGVRLLVNRPSQQQAKA